MKVNGRPRSFGPARFSLTMTLNDSDSQIKSGHFFRSLAGILSGPVALDLESFDKSE